MKQEKNNCFKLIDFYDIFCLKRLNRYLYLIEKILIVTSQFDF